MYKQDDLLGIRVHDDGSGGYRTNCFIAIDGRTRDEIARILAAAEVALARGVAGVAAQLSRNGEPTTGPELADMVGSHACRLRPSSERTVSGGRLVPTDGAINNG